MSNAQVTVYSTTWCGFCHMAKEYFKSKGVAYKDVNVEEDMAAGMYIQQKTGQMGVPVIEIGDETIIGFDRPKIDKALGDNKLV
jgi:glutaredoxin 3